VPELKIARPKRLFIVAGALVGLLTLPVLAYLLGIDPMVRHSARGLVEDALRVPVRIDRARVRLRGTAAFYGVSISNPTGYQEAEACRFECLDGYVTVPSLFLNDIQVHDLVLSHPVFTVEFAEGKSNWGTLIGNLVGEDPPADAKSSPEAPAEETTFRITRLRIIDGVVRFRSSLIPGGVATISLPDLELADLGTAPGSATPIRIVLAVLFQLLGGGAMEQKKVPLPSDVRATFTREMKGAAKSLSRWLGPEKKQ
jgi:hypothetical protein